MVTQKLSKNEAIKQASGYLRGTLPEELTDEAAPAFSDEAAALVKFHGIYQQDDRDVRRDRGRAGLGKDWSCMVRASIPGGVLSADQYLVADRLADEVGSGNLRATTRQGLQYHFTRKGELGRLVGTLNKHLVTTLAACGDVVRNVMTCPAPLGGRAADGELQAFAAELSRQVKPKTEAYWQLWVDGERAAELAAPPPEGAPETEPLYGPTYLPRKFKIAIAPPGDNCVDVFTQDIGLAAHSAGDRIDGFTVLVGGGLGMTHKKPATYPRLADPLGFVPPEQALDVIAAVIGVQRDHGDRADRKHARLKYLVDDWGLDAFRAEVERRLGWVLSPPRVLAWQATEDHLGWHEQPDGRWFLGVRVQSGRIQDSSEAQLRTALREAVGRHAAGVRITPRQDVLLTGIAPQERNAVAELLHRYGVTEAGQLAPVERSALACPAMPTCGLAIAEAERVLSDIVADVHAELAGLNLEHESVHLRVAGCPNGCSRPYSTEIGIVGRGVDRYVVFLGGAADGTRLAREYADQVPRANLGALLAPVLRAWRDGRDPGETFGDYCDRVGVAALADRGLAAVGSAHG